MTISLDLKCLYGQAARERRLSFLMPQLRAIFVKYNKSYKHEQC